MVVPAPTINIPVRASILSNALSVVPVHLMAVLGNEQIYTLYPQEITFRGGRIVFTMGGTMLSTIEVFNDANVLVKRVSLSQSAYASSPSNRPKVFARCCGYIGEVMEALENIMRSSITNRISMPPYYENYAIDPRGVSERFSL